MNEVINESAITFSHQRDGDGKIAITAVLFGGQTFTRSIWAQEADDRARYLNELCAEYPGIAGERKVIRAELLKIARATEIDLRFNTCGQINGRASCSARLWAGTKVIETASLNLLAADSRNKAIKHLVPFVAGRNAGKRKLVDAENRLRRLFMAELQRVLSSPAQQPARTVDHDHCPYYFDGRGIVMKSKDGEMVLSNFGARIAAIVTRNDGQESKSDFELEVTTADGVKRSIVVRSKEFSEMKWPIEQLHDDGYIHPDRNASAHVRAAIMQFSRNPKPEKKMIYTHTGWLKLGDSHVYLHGGGAISAEAEPPKVEVALHKALSRYVLPEPPTGVALKACIRASLKLLELAPLRVVLPGYCAVWRSILGPCDSGVFTVGPSGAFKSELMALRLQHFGAGLDRMHLPANFSSTPNALELIAFAAKDTALGVDDFAPYGSRNQIDALHGTAERLFRAQGNQSGRQRSSKEAEVGEAKPPRGIIIASGEDVPRGKSLRARLMIEEVAPGDIAPAKLSLCQRDGRDGLYAGMTAGFLRWLCPRIAEVQKNLRTKIDELRERAMTSGAHRRTPEVVANLLVGFMYVLEFATEAEAITKDEAERLWQRAWAAMGDVAQQQAAMQADNDPAHRFIELLSSALLSGEMHLTNADGNAPDDEIAGAVGWWKRTASSNVWEPRGLWGGLIDDDRDVFLEFDAAYRAAQRAAGGVDGLVISASTLRKRLQEGGYLQGADRNRTAVRKRVKGALRMMVCLSPRATGGLFARTARTARTGQEGMPFSDAPEGETP